MVSLKENLEVESRGAVLAVQELTWRLRQWFLGLEPWKRIILVVMTALLLVGSFMIRYGLEAVLTYRYNQLSVIAQPAFSRPDALVVSAVSVVKGSGNFVSAYATIKNPNLDLALTDLTYTMNFENSIGDKVGEVRGSLYLLPDQQRWLVVPRFESIEIPTKASLTFGELKWQKRLSLPEVNLRMTEPLVYQQEQPNALIGEGAVINTSPYYVKQATLVFVLYGTNNQILSVTSREENNLSPYERRAYIMQWPNLNRSSVQRVGLEAYTNTLDPANLSVAEAPSL